MAKKKQQSVATPTIDKLVKAREKVSDNDIIPQQPTPHYKIYQHPIFIVWRLLKQWLMLVPFLLLFLLLPIDTLSSTSPLIMQLLIGLLMLTVIISNYVYWRLNVTLVFPETLQIFYFNNLLRQHNEDFEISRLNTFDVLREGLLCYVFDYGTLNLSTIVKEVESQEKLCIENVRKPDEAIKMIKYYALKT